MLDGILDDILKNSPDAGEIRPDSPLIRPAQSRVITELSPDSPNSPGLNAFGDDDCHYCRECRHLNSNGYCTAQRFRPVDDMPRRCADFTGHPVSTPTTVSNTQDEGLILFKETSQPGTLLVTVYTPSGTPMTIRADDAEHAAWLRKMNPKPANPAPKPTTPEPDAARISEAEHNADGRFFKFLATWPDGSQCYLCQMPRQTVDEMRAQYPDTIYIAPIEGEEYPDDY